MSSDNMRSDLDKAQIEQLHQLVLQLSKNCFEIKKLCATLLVSVATFAASFAKLQLDCALFAAVAVVVLCFYILDAQSCYYQRKVRIRMADLAAGLLGHDGKDAVSQGFGMPLESPLRSRGAMLRRALFNGSMLFYAFLAVLEALLVVLWRFRVIESLVPLTPR